MKNTLSDLNDYLFEQIERINDDDLTEEELHLEITRAQAVSKVAEIVVRNGELALKTMQHLNEYGYGCDQNAIDHSQLAPVPKMLSVKMQ